MKRQIAITALTPLGDALLMMSELEELHRIYDPCEVTVFAIPLIAELYRGYRHCDKVVVLKGGIHGKVELESLPEVTYDAVFNHGYEPWWTEIVRKLKHRKAYGMEELYRSAEECEEVFDEWVSLEKWKTETVVKYKLVPEQMAEVVRLASPGFRGGAARLGRDNYAVAEPGEMPKGKYVLFMPGTSAKFKHYPMKKVIAVARAVERTELEPVFAIGPQDGAEREGLRGTGWRIYDTLPLAELAGLVLGAEAVVGNDSGPMHFAAAFDAPTVHLFSHSGAHTWFVYDEERHKLLMPECGRRDGRNCGSCERTCIGMIRIGEVVNAISELTGKKKGVVR